MKKLFIIIFIFCSIIHTHAQSMSNKNSCTAVLKNDTLTIDNGKVTQVFRWNNGNLIRLSLSKKDISKSFVISTNTPCTQFLPKPDENRREGTFSVLKVPENNVFKEHTLVEVVGFEGDLAIKRVFKLYPHTSSIACDFYLKGRTKTTKENVINLADLKNIESEEAKKQGISQASFLESFAIKGNHWKAKAVEFFDVTDRNNTLVQQYERLLYRQESLLRGNLLFLENQSLNQSFFILKEAPSSSTQLHYLGYDFIVKSGLIKAVGFGLTNSDINDKDWTKAYSIVVGLADGQGAYNILSKLKEYQQNMRKTIPERDEMIMSNTWGDRSQDKKLNEKFLLNEVVAGENLGITHFQIDDGWQTGKSSNSAFGGSLTNIWRNKNYWQPDSIRFPNGLKPIISLANQKGIQISTWFNPSIDSSFKYWESDADVLIQQYKNLGIKTWKIDGVNLPDKLSEINFRKFLDKVQVATNGEAVFNLDVTAGRRFGYHYGYEYGNIFLENRYTDWGNYYPYWTLRNLWMLAPYVPTQRIQVEFLNKWRNSEKYANDDELKPSNYPFETLFAIGMFAQPLGWFELGNLPDTAFTLKTTVETYKKYWHNIHQGQIFPIGNEPNGIAWTGFQSIISPNEGYVLVFRENNKNATCEIKLWNVKAGNYFFEHILGEGKSFSRNVKGDDTITFSITNKYTYSLYKYKKK